MNKVLVCDVDGVVVNLAYDWYSWLCNAVFAANSNIVLPKYIDIQKHYDFGIPFKDILPYGVKASDFWKQEDLYDDAIPAIGAQEFIQSFKDKGWDIVWASHVEGGHAKSKYEFLKKWFPVDGFVATREKQYIHANIAIDDRIRHLINRDDNRTLLVWKETPYEQEKDILNEWEEREVAHVKLSWMHEQSATHLQELWEGYYGR